jgi:hypothetical protein
MRGKLRESHKKYFPCFFFCPFSLLYLAHNIDWHRQQERKTLFPQFNKTQIIALEKKLLKQIFPLSSATTRKKVSSGFSIISKMVKN